MHAALLSVALVAAALVVAARRRDTGVTGVGVLMVLARYDWCEFKHTKRDGHSGFGRR